ncbi:MAG: amidohydrolase family protein [Rhodobacteraceae bacterium]|nr:amidohydrolase family protein [Paracoccaceae bacterium]
MGSYRLRGAQVVTMDDALGDLAAADILVRDGTIAALGPAIAAEGAEVIEAAGMIALPGIIDAHTCLWQTVLRGALPDAWSDAYFATVLPLRLRFLPEDNFAATLVGAHEMLSCGVTTVVDYCHNARGPGYAEASLEALRASGIRHVFTFSFMTPEPDLFASMAARMAAGGRLHECFHDPDTLTTVHFGIESFGHPWCERHLAFARETGTPASLHVHGPDVVGAMKARGMLGPDLGLVHGNLLTDEDLALMAGAGMSLCFTPSVDVCGKRADVVGRAVRRGIPVTFGCDIPCHVASDTLAQLRIMFAVQNFLDGEVLRAFTTVTTPRPRPTAEHPLLSPRKLLRMATIGTARALGMADRIGSLTPGKRADIVLVRGDRFGASVAGDPCAHVLLQTSARDIDTVLVDGRPRVRGGALPGYDEARARRGLAAARARILG